MVGRLLRFKVHEVFRTASAVPSYQPECSKSLFCRKNLYEAA